MLDNEGCGDSLAMGWAGEDLFFCPMEQGRMVWTAGHSVLLSVLPTCSSSCCKLRAIYLMPQECQSAVV